MSLKYLNLSGLEDLWINIKNYILSKIPTKTSELTNDSGYLTSHQSLDNYVDLNTTQTITAIKVITGGNQGKMLFKNPNYTKGDAVESGVTVSRLYFGNGTSYATANGILTFDITSSGNTALELAALNNTASSSYRASLIITYDKSATRPRLLKSWGDFIPNSDNNYTLGNTSNIWKECYSNAYYLGTTAFGDIVTHNASEFLTSHQSLSSCVKNNVTNNQTIKSTGITRGTAPSSTQTFGIVFSDNNAKYIGNVYGHYATDKSTYVGLYAYKGTTTSNSDNVSIRVGYNASGNAYTYAPTPATADNSTQIATTAFVKAQGYLTSHPSITLSSNTTSTASPAHGGTFTCIDSVTQDTNGHITKVNTKTITLPADSNTDTKVTQTVTTDNSGYPVLLCATADATATGTTTSRFSAGLTVNARYSSIYMTNKYDTANTKGVRDSTKGYLNGDIIFRCYDASEMGRIHCESSKSGYQQTYMQARSYIKNGAISPKGTATTCYITVRVRDNGSKTIYTDGSWENSLIPYANNTHSLGTSSLQWKNAYTKKINNLEPSSLSLPNPSNSIDISAYFTRTGTGETNVYAVPSNGWIFLYLATISSCEAKVLDAAQNVLWGTNDYDFREMLMIPVVTGSTLQTQWTTEYSTVTVLTAKFYPCQGNV